MSPTIEAAAKARTPEIGPDEKDPPLPSGEQAVTIDGIDWGVFEAIAKGKGDPRHPRLIYDEGSLTLVSPGYLHEHLDDRIGCLVMAVCAELGIPCNAAGATLFKRERSRKGVEGDRTYYIANERAVRGKTEIDANIDPPPDLAVEVEITHPAQEAVEIWRALGTPEVWVIRARERKIVLTILQRDAEGRYAEAPTSRAFPFLSAAEIRDKVGDETDEPESFWERRLRQWVRDELAPRMAQGEPPR